MALLALAAAALLLTSCPGNGGADRDSDGETYGGTGSSSSSSSTRSSGSNGSYTANFSFDEFIRLTNAGDTDALVKMFQDDSASSGSAEGGEYGVDTLVMSAADLGVPAGGSVTLSITGGDDDYEETATVDDDGNVCFSVPRQRVGSTITISMTVKKEDGSIVRSGKKTMPVEAGCQFSIALSSGVPEDFVFVAGGTFTSASLTLAAAGSQTIADFYICSHEVTQGEYTAVIGSNPSNFTGSPAAGEEQSKRPVEQVRWYDALVYCNRRSMAEGLTPCYSIGGSTDPDAWGSVPTGSSGTWDAATCNFAADGYRLPTQWEWEYAASDGHTYSGSNTAGTVAWYTSNSGSKTHEVKTKEPNAKGIYDMSGNVYEWCWDKYSSSSSDRVSHGGSWNYAAYNCEVSVRDNLNPTIRGSYQGFRLVRNAD